ncbi:TrmB family transcriptional regulator [Pectinatus sottacetonis]|uniref:TrmB family transcriptional regulator n=1 Tax=Pectinatus sottacetonis TaxID=1002795 RepID=UPI0018C7CD8A|nr:TrmB family transcriptional regulator [Pectinatus sottacetonis]
MNDKQSNVVNELMKIGLTKYEASVYVTLLENPRITAYEISKRSSVPQSKIYSIVKELVNKNFLNLVDQISPKKYVAIPLDDLLENYKKETDSRIKYIKENAKNMNTGREYDYFLHFYGTEKIFNKLHEMVQRATESLYLDIWAEDYEKLYDDLFAAQKRGVKIVCVVYGPVKCELGKMYYHEMEGMIDDAAQNGRWLSLVSDYSQCLFAILKPLDSCGFWTQNKAFMLVTECFITHDILIAEIYGKFRPMLVKEFGPNLEKIRKNLKIG